MLLFLKSMFVVCFQQSHDELVASEMCLQSNRDDAIGKSYQDNFVELGITPQQLREMKTRGRKVHTAVKYAEICQDFLLGGGEEDVTKQL